MLLRPSLCAVCLLLVGALAPAQNPQPAATEGRPISHETRLLLIRSLSSEFAFAHRAIPLSLGTVVIRDGQIVSPTPQELDQMAASRGSAAKPGERVQITSVQIRDNKIVCEINGGPKKHSKFFDHVQVGVGPAQTKQQDENSRNPKGSIVELQFHRHVPELTGDQVRQLLSPLFDFTAKSAAEAYIETVPPKAKAAIQNHEVLVGMDREMVTYAKGRPDQRVRERDERGQMYEEWLYGEPPQQVEFVRFVGDEVVRLVIMRVDGQRIERSERELEPKKTVAAKEEAPPPARPARAPSLRRPGEVPANEAARGQEQRPVELPPRQQPAPAPGN